MSTQPTDTPRTDAEEIDLTTHTAIEGLFPNRRQVVKYVPSKLARQLERKLRTASDQLAAAREELHAATRGKTTCSECGKPVNNAWRDSDGHHCLTCLARERNQLREENAALRAENKSITDFNNELARSIAPLRADVARLINAGQLLRIGYAGLGGDPQHLAPVAMQEAIDAAAREGRQ